MSNTILFTMTKAIAFLTLTGKFIKNSFTSFVGLFYRSRNGEHEQQGLRRSRRLKGLSPEEVEEIERKRKRRAERKQAGLPDEGESDESFSEDGAEVSKMFSFQFLQAFFGWITYLPC